MSGLAERDIVSCSGTIASPWSPRGGRLPRIAASLILALGAALGLAAPAAAQLPGSTPQQQGTSGAGINPRVVQERLGHSSIVITLSTYSHVSAGLQREAAEQVAALFGREHSVSNRALRRGCEPAHTCGY